MVPGEGQESHHLTGWSGWEASRLRGANEPCATGVCPSVPSLPCLRPEPAAATPQRLAHPSLRPARSGSRGLQWPAAAASSASATSTAVR